MRLAEVGSTAYFCSPGCREQYKQERLKDGIEALSARDTPVGYPKRPTKEEGMETKRYLVPGVHCGHCQAAITRELEGVSGVDSVDIDLETKLVTVSGNSLEDAQLVAAIDEAGYDAERVAA